MYTAIIIVIVSKQASVSIIHNERKLSLAFAYNLK